MAKKYSLTREDLQNAKKQILANPHDTSGLDPRIMQWLQDSGFLGEQFFRGQLGFMRSLSGLDDDSGFVERIDFFGGHAAGEIMQALDHANAFYGMDMQVNGTEYTITCDGVKVLSGVYDEKNDVIYSKIEDDTPVENIDAALHTMIFMHCSSAASSDSNILTPEFSDNVLENIRALQIALYEAHMHILMDKNQLKLEMDKIDQLEKDSDITPKHAAALRKELQYIFDHCKTFLDKPQRDINGFREIMHYDYSSSGIASSARDTVQKFATKSTESAAIFDRAPWQPGARPAR